MAETIFAEAKRKFRSHKLEIVVGFIVSIPFLLFIIFAWIEGDFTILDHSYWVGVIAYNVAIIFGVWFVYSNRTLYFSPMILYYSIGLSILILTAFLVSFFTGDITEGVIAGSKVLWEGENPYVVEKIPHAQPDSPEFRWTTYPYLPVDLLTYTILLGAMSSLSSLILGQNL